MTRTVLALAIALLLGTGCTGPASSSPLSGAAAEKVKAELSDRSFRQFAPGLDGDPRKAVVLDFFSPLTLWAQYAEADRAVSEWEIVSGDYMVKGDPEGSQVTLRLISPQTSQTFPTQCQDCIETVGVSISIRNVFNPDRIAFRINDPDGVLPSPFPVFQKWTTFYEDEIQH